MIKERQGEAKIDLNFNFKEIYQNYEEPLKIYKFTFIVLPHLTSYNHST